MPTKECCSTCQHCCAGQTSADAWCRLRKIRVHPEIAVFALCHHWTKRPPMLPKIREGKHEPAMDKQLELGRTLVGIDR